MQALCFMQKCSIWNLFVLDFAKQNQVSKLCWGKLLSHSFQNNCLRKYYFHVCVENNLIQIDTCWYANDGYVELAVYAFWRFGRMKIATLLVYILLYSRYNPCIKFLSLGKLRKRKKETVISTLINILVLNVSVLVSNIFFKKNPIVLLFLTLLSTM